MSEGVGTVPVLDLDNDLPTSASGPTAVYGRWNTGLAELKLHPPFPVYSTTSSHNSINARDRQINDAKARKEEMWCGLRLADTVPG